MKRALLLVVVVAFGACGKSDAPAPTASAEPTPVAKPMVMKKLDVVKSGACEGVRDKYLDWQADRVKSALQGVPADQKAALQAEADKEAAQAKDRFVDACSALGDQFDATCFDHKGLDPDRAHKKHCDDVVHALEAKMFAH